MPADTTQLALALAPPPSPAAPPSPAVPPAGAAGEDRPDPAPEEEAEPRVEIRPSTRRRKTIDAYWEHDTIVVVVPHRLPKRDRQAYADELAAKLIAARRKTRPTDAGLMERAVSLSERYLDGAAVPAAVTWSSRQRTRWGSCTPADRTIRVSAMLKGVPGWVLDAVLVHELAHLLRAEHDDAFHELLQRYPRSADAEQFLAGYQLGLQRGAATSR